MSQETHLFDGMIRDNLLIALPEAEIRDGGAAGVLDARLREALAKASVLDLIDSLPDGLDTQVGELGDRLSEGERQRIGLAVYSCAMPTWCSSTSRPVVWMP